MKKYIDDNGQVVEVVKGLSDWWICARGGHRVKTKYLPPRKSADLCQQDLDAYARGKGWRVDDS